MSKTRIAITGYGNLGKGVELEHFISCCPVDFRKAGPLPCCALRMILRGCQVAFVEEDHGRDLPLLHGDQEAVQESHVRLRLMQGKDNHRLVDIGDLRTEQPVFPGKDPDHVARKGLFRIQDRFDLRDISHERLFPSVPEDPAGPAFIISFRRMNVIEAADAFVYFSCKYHKSLFTV